MGETVKLILSLSVSGGLFALALLALKPFMRNRLAKSFQYYIWLVVLLRFILPFSFGINLMDFTLNMPKSPQTVEEAVVPNNNPENPANINPAVNNNNPNIAEQQPSTPGSTDSAKPFDIMKPLVDNLLWIWLAGAIMSAVFNILGYFRFIRYVHGAACAVEMPDCGATVYKSRFAPTPMLVGVIKPRIYLPDIEYTDGQLDNILLHELTHLRRRDVWLKWFAALVVSVHWFNPIVYFMRREFSRACELSCDEAVIRTLDGTAKQNYGDTLISVVAVSRYPIGVMSITMCEEKKKLKERLVAIMNYKKKTKIAVLLTAVLAVVITGSAFAVGVSIKSDKPTVIPDRRITWTEAMNLLENSVMFTDGELSFQIPTNYPTTTDWSIRISGRAEFDDGFSMSLHYLTEEGENKSWEAGKRYVIPNDQPSYEYITELTMDYSLPDPDGYLILIERHIDLLSYISLKSNETYSISLTELRQFAVKGDEIVWADFSEYNGQDVLSGLYSMFFKIEGGYTLLVAGGEPSGKPMYTRFNIPGVEESIDIRYDDIDDFIGKYPVPNELSSQIYEYLDTIMSSPSLSSATGDYIKAHQTEFDMIVDMGVTALPTLTGILNNSDMSLRGNIAVLLVQDIITEENKTSKAHSEWCDGALQSAASDVERWRRSRDFPINVNKNGQTYGSGSVRDEDVSNQTTQPIVLPDLILAKGIDGTVGYVYQSDLDGEQPNNPEEAMKYMERLEERYEEMRQTGEEYARIIPLYAEDGETVIGGFGIGGLPPEDSPATYDE